MKIAVTGASGFIGRHVLDVLAPMDDVHVVASARSLPTGRLGRRLEQVSLDLEASDPDRAFTQLGRPDAVIHLAWNGLPNYKSLRHFESELGVQYRFLSGLVNAGLRSLTCTGTCFEYGMQAGALSEAMETRPDNPYGFAKASLHSQLRFLQRSVPFDLTWGRLFYMFGPGQPASSLYTQFQAACARGDASFPMSGGEQLRDFLPVTEIARLIVQLTIKAPGSGAVNICSGTPVSVRSLVERWRQANDSSIQLDLGRYPYPDYEPMAFWGSDGRLAQLLGSRPGAGL